jgi:hypothetical protein
MLNKTLENLKMNKTFDKALQTLNASKAIEGIKALAQSDFVQGIREKSEAISQVTLTEKEKLVDRLVESLLKGQELGSDPSEVRSKIKSKLFEHEKGDTLFLNNLKYINQVLASSMPRSLSELSEFRETIAQKLVLDAKQAQGNSSLRKSEKRDHSNSQQHRNDQSSQNPRSERRPRGERVQRAAASHKPSKAERNEDGEGPNLEKANTSGSSGHSHEQSDNS